MNIADRIISRCLQRDPDELIGNGQNEVYMRRWHIVRIKWLCNIYVHQFLRDDDDRALHDHPWHSLSWMMRGYLCEISHDKKMVHGKRWDPILEGQWTFRSARFSHRLQVPINLRGKVWTLFITGPKVREWGFWCKEGWIHWKEFCARGYVS